MSPLELEEEGGTTVCERDGDLTDCDLLPLLAASLRSPVELAWDRGRMVDDRSDMAGRSGVGVEGPSSSLSFKEGLGLDRLPSDNECTRLTEFF